MKAAKIVRVLALGATLIVAGCEIHETNAGDGAEPTKMVTTETRADFSADEARRLLDTPRVSPLVTRAPAGLPKRVAAEIIARQPGLACDHVTAALRVRDGSIVARCAGGEMYRVGGLFDMPGQRAMACGDIAPLTQQRPC